MGTALGTACSGVRLPQTGPLGACRKRPARCPDTTSGVLVCASVQKGDRSRLLLSTRTWEPTLGGGRSGPAAAWLGDASLAIFEPAGRVCTESCGA